MLITVDNDFVIYNRYTLKFLLLESRNSKTIKFCFFMLRPAFHHLKFLWNFIFPNKLLISHVHGYASIYKFF